MKGILLRMSDNKKYYYLKLKENFFESDDIRILESMENGYKYSNILLKLYLKALKHNGALRLNEYIPYNAEMIATLTGHNIDTVRVALKIFRDLRLIEVLENGTIYMLDIQNFVGQSSSEADRKRLYREKIKCEKLTSGTNTGQMSDVRPPEIELEIEKDIELEKDSNTSKDVSSNKLQPVIDTWNSLKLNKLISINPGTNRYKLLQARIKEFGIDNVIQAIKNIKDSKFLVGQNNRGWVVTFDWLIKPNNFIKVLEGNYADKEIKEAGKKLKFTDYEGQRVYDYDSLENKLLGWDEE